MPRKPKPEIEPYLRLIMGIPTYVKILSISDQERLFLATKIIEFVERVTTSDKKTMSHFLKWYAGDRGVSVSFCYKVLAKLKKLTLIKFDDYWNEYQLNMERWKRDKRALDGFKSFAKRKNGQAPTS